MAKLAERYLDARLSIQPVQASYVGYHRYDGRLPDYSKRGIQAALRKLRYFDSALQKIDAKKLSTPWAIDRALIEASVKEGTFRLTELKAFEWDAQMYNEIVGGGLHYITIPPADPADWPQRLESVIARLQAMPALLKQARQNLKRPPKVFTQFAIAQNAGNLKTLQQELPKLFTPYPKLEKRFATTSSKAHTALKDHQRFLKEELLPRSDGDWRLGKTLWERKLRMSHHTETTAQALYEAAERQLRLARFEMYDLALPMYQRMWPGDTSYQDLLGDARINHVVGKVIQEAAKEHSAPQALFEDVKRSAQETRAFIQKVDLLELPPEDDRFVIEPTPPFLDGLAVAFFNPAPAFEPDLKKSFWISSVPAQTSEQESYLREYNRYTLKALTIHEAFPGHYVQMYWSSHAEFASITKQVLESSTMAEGWAVMIEQLMHEAGYGAEDPKNKLFHLKMKLRTFINAMLDSKLHTSTEKEEALDQWALQLMMERGFQERAEAQRKLRRAKLTSTQLSTYFVGYRQMLQIYRDGQKRPDFDRKAFLERMLSFGTIPPKMIRRLLKEEGLL